MGRRDQAGQAAKVLLTVDDVGVLAAQAAHSNRNAAVLRSKPSSTQQQPP